MFSTLTNLLLHKQMVFGDGTIDIFGQPVVINPLNTELNILKELEKLNLENILYYSAKSAGKDWFKNMYVKYGLKPQDIMKWGPDLINLGGWGSVKSLKADISSSTLDFVLLNSTMAKSYGKSDHPVDHYFRGLLTGAWENACSKPLEGIETECLAAGAKACKFKVRPKESLDILDPLVKQQLNLK